MATKGSHAKISGDQDLYGDRGVPIIDKDFGASEFVSILLSNGRRFRVSVRVQPCYGLRRYCFKRSQ